MNMREVDDIAVEYESLLPNLKALKEEAVFIVGQAIDASGIKIHSEVDRIKTLDSARDKLTRNEMMARESLADITDLVGIRVVVLFLSDVPNLIAELKNHFTLLSEDDKVAAIGGESEFGYMSFHLIVTMKDEFAGPRYDLIRGMPFEIQVRTILMDAWANVSHHLDYKGDASIPEELRRDFYALSGLFYVADKHFELFFDRSRQSQDDATHKVQLPDASGVQLNLDTLEAFIRERFPNRSLGPREIISQVVEELAACGYSTIGDLEGVLERQHESVATDEEERARQAGRSTPVFSGIAFVRISLRNEVGFERWRDSTPRLRSSYSKKARQRTLAKKVPAKKAPAKKAPSKKAPPR